MPVYVVETERDSSEARSTDQQGSAAWSVVLSLNDTAGGGGLFSDGYLTSAERTAGGNVGVVKIQLQIDDLDAFSGISFGYVKVASDPGTCTASTGTYDTSTAVGLKFSNFTSDGPYFVCLRASDDTATVYDGPVGFTVDTVAPTLGNATYTLPDPAGANHAGRLEQTVGGTAALDGALSVFVKGSYAYVAASESGALEVVDVSDPTAPSHAGKLADGDGGAELTEASSVFVRGDYAYVASGGNAGALQIVDVSDPSSPSHAGKLSLNDPMGVFVRGDHAYVALDSGDALAVVDVRNPGRAATGVDACALAVGGARAGVRIGRSCVRDATGPSAGRVHDGGAQRAGGGGRVRSGEPRVGGDSVSRHGFERRLRQRRVAGQSPRGGGAGRAGVRGGVRFGCLAGVGRVRGFESAGRRRAGARCRRPGCCWTGRRGWRSRAITRTWRPTDRTR